MLDPVYAIASYVRLRDMNLRIGSQWLISVNDGEFTMPKSFLGDERAHDLLAGPDGEAHLPIGCFLLPGDDPVLVDAGLGPDWVAPGMLQGGDLLNGLRQRGFAPEDIRTVCLSHLHADHVGWIATKNAGVTFPNAQVYVARADYDHFVTSEQGPLPMPWVKEALVELLRIGRLTLFDGEQLLATGVTALPAPGHTPGHTVYVIHDDGERALLFGDAIYCPQQLSRTDWESMSDVDPVLARRTREVLWRELEGTGTVGTGAHFPGLVAGRVLSGAWQQA
jgi:glyoxylase-like metal-dependent hydrolase (beta-lactamase superfamily II)